MSEEEIKDLLKQNLQLTRAIYESMEKQRKIRKWTLIISIAVIVIPLIASIFIIPWAFGNISDYYQEVFDLLK
ncbi:MAG: hypothetical protein Q8P20_06505 [bacterium]|nr:hypothetical protein [bacterium]